MLSTEVKTYVIRFKDNSKQFITTAQEEAFWNAQAQGAKGIKIDGAYIDFAMVGRLLSVEQYYEAYPDERPEEPVKEWVAPKDEYVPIEKQAEQSKEMFQGMLKGLKALIEKEQKKGNTPKHAIAMFNDKVLRYKQKYGT